jgi:hypothetical protein
MIWNSVVFQSRIVKEFAAVTVFRNFTQGAAWTIPPVSSLGGMANPQGYLNIVSELQQEVQDGGLETLNAESCYYEYMEAGHVRNVLWVIDPLDWVPKDPAILDDASFLGSHLSVLAAFDLSSIAGVDGFCGPNKACGDSSHCSPNQADLGDQGGAPIRVCYVSPASKNCKASIAPLFLILVILCVTVKAVCFLLTLHVTKRDTRYAQSGMQSSLSSIHQTSTHATHVWPREQSIRYSGSNGHQGGLVVWILPRLISGKVAVDAGSPL